MRSRTSIAKLGLILLLSSCGGGGIGGESRVRDWLSVIDGTGERWGRDVAFTTTDDVILVGAFDVDAVFDAGQSTEVTLTSTGGWNSYIAKYQKSGEFDWAVSIGGSDVFLQAVAVDNRRWIAVAGYTPGSAVFRFPDGSTETVVPPSGAIEAGFVALYDSDGRLVWVRELLGDFFTSRPSTWTSTATATWSRAASSKARRCSARSPSIRRLPTDSS